MFKSTQEIVKAKEDGKALSSLFESLLKSKKFLGKIENPFEYLSGCKLDYIDMTTDSWCSLSTKQQIQYASLYQEWYAHQLNKKKEKSLPCGEIFIDMLFIPPGRYWQGSLESEKNLWGNEVRRRVLISKAFWCSKYTITEIQYEKVMNEKLSKLKDKTNKPVRARRWSECDPFCKKTNTKLLTEAQWEYACRGGTTSIYSFGDSEKKLNEYAWKYTFSGFFKGVWGPQIVGQKKPNSFGLYDMHGNAWERCLDIYKDYGEKKRDNISPWKMSMGIYKPLPYDDKRDVTDPINSGSDAEHSDPGQVFRGGSWDCTPSYCGSARRVKQLGNIDAFSGFRVSRS